MSSPTLARIKKRSPSPAPLSPRSAHHPLVLPPRFFPISTAELSLPAVLKCGQTFRWTQSLFNLYHASSLESEDEKKPDLDCRRTEVEEWSMGWDDRTVVLRQEDAGIHYTALYPPSATEAYQRDLDQNTTFERLKEYFVLDVSLVELYRDWARRDPVFSGKVASGKWDGLRVCRQDAWETTVSFICSANNNIPRITLMLDRLCATFGTRMPSAPLGATLSVPDRLKVAPSDAPLRVVYSFPCPRRLAQADVPAQLKQLGFGYRANYVWKTAVRLCEIAQQAQQEDRWPALAGAEPSLPDEKPVAVGPREFLDVLARQPYTVAHATLVSEFPGVGPKVGDCICLFGLGFVHIVPVDVHVYQIALRDYQFATSSPKKASVQSKSPRRSPEKPPAGGGPGTPKGPVSKLDYGQIQKQLHDLWGPWAGWAQQILFLADLKYENLASPTKAKTKTKRKREGSVRRGTLT